MARTAGRDVRFRVESRTAEDEATGSGPGARRRRENARRCAGQDRLTHETDRDGRKYLRFRVVELGAETDENETLLKNDARWR